jgi:Holliday junction DNA helicase RuvA
MIGHLRGTLIDKRPNQVLLDVAGVGYQVQIPLSTFYAIGELKDEVSLMVHTHVRDDALVLYGFLTAREKHFFELLISAQGIGPSLAVKILSNMSVDDLLEAISSRNIERLTKIPSVGKKTAERIIVELRDKLAQIEAASPAEEKPAARGGLAADVVSALLNLGYDRRTAEKAAEEAQRNGSGNSFEALLRASLQSLSRPTSRGAG